MQLNAKVKKVADIATKVVTWLLVAFTVFMMVFTVFTVTTVNKNDRSIFGIKFYIVQTGSMSKSENNKDDKVHFDPGDIILVKDVKDPKKMEAGDIISFMSTNKDSYGETITHKIKEVKPNGNSVAYVTYGTNTGAVDEAMVEPEYILGEYAGKLPGVGNFFAYVKTTPGYIVCILIPFLLLILYNGINCVKLFRAYKKEQNAEIEAERAAIAKEREEAAEMMKKLEALQAQLNSQLAQNAAAAESKNDTDGKTD